MELNSAFSFFRKCFRSQLGKPHPPSWFMWQHGTRDFVDRRWYSSLGPAGQSICSKGRRSLDRAGAPWHLRYLGQPEMGDKNRHALVRNCVTLQHLRTSLTSSWKWAFMDHEFVARDTCSWKGIMKAVVYKIFRILVPGNTDNTEALSLSYLVELRRCCTSWAGHGLWWHEELCRAAETSGSPRENRPQGSCVKTICPQGLPQLLQEKML